MHQPRQFRLIPREVLVIQRNGALRRDLEIAEWMDRSAPDGEYLSFLSGAGLCMDCVQDYPLLLEVPYRPAELDRTRVRLADQQGAQR